MQSLAIVSAVVAVAYLGTSIASAQSPKTSENSLGMTLVHVPSGKFEMGMLDEHRLKLEHKSSAYQREIHDYVEAPAFPVKISRPYSFGATEVTVGQFRKFVEATGYQTDAEKAGGAFIFSPDAEEPLDRFQFVAGTNWHKPGFEQSDRSPVTCVSWNDAQEFCRWLGEKEDATYRLPTEAEWEYACRAGTRSSYWCGENPDKLYGVANVADATLHAAFPNDVLRQRTAGLDEGAGDHFIYTAPVASFPANPWGFHDMHGNVWEWCSDKYSDRYYKDMIDLARQQGSRSEPQPIVDPQGPDDTPKHRHGDWRSLRGGSWYVAPLQCRSSVRAFAEAKDAFSYIGFRVIKVETESPTGR